MPPSLLLAVALCAPPGPPLQAQEPPVHPAPDKDSPSQPIGSQFILDATLGLRQYVHDLKLVHTLSLKNVANRSLVLPDYVRRTGLASVPSDDLGRQASYTLRIVF